MKKTPDINAASQYKTVDTHTGIMEASPHRLIRMLLDGAIGKIAMAKGSMQRKEFRAKGDHVTSAASIIVGLRESLDMEAGGDLVGHLASLYDYMIRRLMEAHAKNDIAGLDEVAGLLHEVKRGWEAIPEDAISGGDMLESMVGT